MIEFLSKSDQILGTRIGFDGGFDDGTLRSEMDAGDDKARVINAAPNYNLSVVLLCTIFGRQMFYDFYLNQLAQGANYFIWPWLRGIDDDTRMKITSPPSDKELAVNGVGLWEISFSLKIRSLPNAPSAALIAEVNASFGGVADLYFTNVKLKKLSLEPQLTKWGGLL